MKNKTLDILIIIVFFALSALFSVAALFVSGNASNREQPRSRPELTLAQGGINPNFTSEMTDYVAENFAFRNELIDLNSRFMTGLLGTSPVEKVICGREEWLFFSETLPDYLGTAGFSEEQLEVACRNLLEIQEYVEQQGAQFLFVPVPNKNSVYGDYMPYGSENSGRRLDALFDELDRCGVNYIDLRESFDIEEILYLKADSHWNMLGASIAADEINSAMGRESAFTEGMRATGISESGDLFEMLYPVSDWEEPDYEYGQGFKFEYASPFRSAEDIRIATHCETGDGSLLMFRDSFGNSLYSFMAESFENAIFSRENNYRLDFMAQNQAQYVVIELVERNLNYLVEYTPVFPEVN